MAVQTFNPTDLSQSAANWAVAQRIVGPFAPHAQVTPNLTLALDPGYLLSGTTLTEVNAQNIGPFAPPGSGFRIDRVVIDRATGVASIVAGAANSLTPPAIPAGKLPVARVMLQPTTDVIGNDLIVDERALVDQTSIQSNQVIARATLGGVSQGGVASNLYTKVNLSTVDFNIGNAFDVVNHQFKPSIAGYYTISGQVSVSLSGGSYVGASIYKNGTTVTAVAAYRSTAGGDLFAQVSDIVYLNGSTDYVELLGAQGSGTAKSFTGQSDFTFFWANRIG